MFNAKFNFIIKHFISPLDVKRQWCNLLEKQSSIDRNKMKYVLIVIMSLSLYSLDM